jgi:hypothetical protein
MYLPWIWPGSRRKETRIAAGGLLNSRYAATVILSSVVSIVLRPPAGLSRVKLTVPCVGASYTPDWSSADAHSSTFLRARRQPSSRPPGVAGSSVRPWPFHGREYPSTSKSRASEQVRLPSHLRRSGHPGSCILWSKPHALLVLRGSSNVRCPTNDHSRCETHQKTQSRTIGGQEARKVRPAIVKNRFADKVAPAPWGRRCKGEGTGARGRRRRFRRKREQRNSARRGLT